MEFSFRVSVAKGQVNIEGPIDNPSLCLQLLADAMRVLAMHMEKQKQQAAPAKPQLFMPDGSIAPAASAN